MAFRFVIDRDDLEQREVAYWLPPNGHRNGIDAKVWVLLAELDDDEMPFVLSTLADAGVAAYASKHHQLYVDTDKRHEATDLLMLLLRGRKPSHLGDYQPRRKAPATARPRGQRLVITVAKYLVGAAILVFFALMLYQQGVNYFNGLQHHPPAKDVPALHQSTPVPLPP